MSSTFLGLGRPIRHENTRGYYERRRRQREKERAFADLPIDEAIFKRMCLGDVLIEAFLERKRVAGQASGPDRLRYDDLSKREACAVMRTVAELIREGKYAPGPTRPVLIPKPSGGHRELRLGSIVDRVVAHALYVEMNSVWEKVFFDRSMAYRPARNVWQLFRGIEKNVRPGNDWLVHDDVRRAFDNVPISRAMHLHRRHITHEPLLDLINKLLRTNRDGDIGIEMGMAYAPAVLNVVLHHCHDVEIDRRDDARWYRYCDNLIYLSPTEDDALDVLQAAGGFLGAAGFQLKGEDGPPINLRRGESTKLLGFVIDWHDDRLRFQLTDEAWRRLEHGFAESHDGERPAQSARQLIEGWIGSHGPALCHDRRRTARRVQWLAARHGFREAQTISDISELCQKAWTNWEGTN